MMMECDTESSGCDGDLRVQIKDGLDTLSSFHSQVHDAEYSLSKVDLMVLRGQEVKRLNYFLWLVCVSVGAHNN